MPSFEWKFCKLFSSGVIGLLFFFYMRISIFTWVDVQILLFESIACISSYDEKVACKKIMEKKGLQGFQVIQSFPFCLC